MNFFQKTNSFIKDKVEFWFYRQKAMHFLAIENKHLFFICGDME